MTKVHSRNLINRNVCCSGQGGGGLGLGGGGLSKKGNGLMDMDNSVVITGRRELNGNGKKYNMD